MALGIGEWAGIVGAGFAAMPVLWGAYQYISIRKSEERGRQFLNYHSIVQSLVETGPYIDRQMASVYELRSYPVYFPVTYRILNRLSKQWSTSDKPAVAHVLKEIKMTLKHIEQSGHRYLEGHEEHEEHQAVLPESKKQAVPA
ncbi:hypothetical protein [Pseudomonas soli]|uniref:hypothetical protein n=1 Tax=Pseudomonas soli TaxID=1306993 RepID=UPI0028A5DBB1|nr:hypothetical protein [Pseudomonas soli]